jgi:hydroxyacid-oxoacid transhydrogenase
MAASSIRFGPGVTREVGMDLKNLGAKRVCVVTDATVDKLEAMRQVREALDGEGVEYRVFKGVKIEPKDYSFVLSHSLTHSRWKDADNTPASKRQ